MKYSCQECGREWDYPVLVCVFCGGVVSKVDISCYVVDEVITVNVPSEDHPLIPYYILMLKDSDGSYHFQKTFQRHNIGDIVNVCRSLQKTYTIGIVGTGITGKGIAEVALLSGSRIVWKSRSGSALINAIEALSKKLSKRMSPEEAESILENIITTTEWGPLSVSDYVIESITEDLPIKRDAFRILDQICPPHVVLATNTSSLQISRISEGLLHPERVAGLHFFNPIARMQLVEIVRGKKTADETIEKCRALVASLNKVDVVVADTPGFIVNRLLFVMINTACHMLDEGVAEVEDIDRAMKLGANYPMGPFELADLIGLDLCLEIIKNLHDSSHGKEYEASHFLEKLVDSGCLGRKSGRGFYQYS
jgi:3-hydroxybutyryl-CoA dehydrogenase